MTELDWYAVLELPRDAGEAEIVAAVERRSRQAAALANTAPERSQQLREQVRAIRRDPLSGAQARRAYDQRLAGPVQAAGPPPGPSAATAGVTQPVAAHPSVPQPFVAEATPDQAQYTEQAQYADQGRRPGRFRAFLQSGWTCWNCGESAMPRDQYCTQCDAQLVQEVRWTPPGTPPTSPNACPYCGTLAASSHRYCRNCGAGRPVA